jgi:hypothetical protein
MKFDLENLNPGTWFDFPDGEGRICLRSLSFEEATEISKKTTKKRRDFGKQGQVYEYEERDDDTQFEMTWKACIVDWEGVYSADGVLIPCTDEFRLKLMKKSPGFARLVRDFLTQLTEAEEQHRGEAEKN